MAKTSLIYQQIASDIINLIDSDKLKANDQLMPVSELCKKYNTSHVTVLKALNSLKEEGYVVSQRGRGYFVAEKANGLYCGKKLGKIGVFLRPMRPISYKEDYFNQIEIGIQVECSVLQLDIIKTHSTLGLRDPYAEPRVLKNIEQACLEMADQVDGFIMDRLITDEVVSNVKRKSGKPIVIVGRSSSLEVDCVMSEGDKGAEDVLRTLKRLGYEFFLFGNSGENSEEIKYREGAFEQAFKANNIAEKDIARFTDFYMRPLEDSYAAIVDLWKKKSQGRKTAVVVSDDRFARDFCDCLQRDNIFPGKDIGVTGYCAHGYATNYDPKLTTVDIHADEIGKLAVKTLQNRVDSGAYMSYRVLSPESTFIIGETI
ncbi:MAG: substrate-binding domain-containing protein [Lentisphaerae bacterium]|nr:substrate-binding domain-containing protein [Lentisphaerota bacterium]MCP4102271.1 substrate-binding domain-containing protein [Lentisphaerota bacterium]